MKAKYFKKLRLLEKERKKAEKENRKIRIKWIDFLIFLHILINNKDEITTKYFPNYRGEWEKQNVLLDVQHKRILDSEADIKKIYEIIHEKCYREKTDDYINKLSVDDIIRINDILNKYVK